MNMTTVWEIGIAFRRPSFLVPLILLAVVGGLFQWTETALIESDWKTIVEFPRVQAISLSRLVPDRPDSLAKLSTEAKDLKSLVREREGFLTSGSSFTYAPRIMWIAVAALELVAVLGFVGMCVRTFRRTLQDYQVPRPGVWIARAVAGIGVVAMVWIRFGGEKGIARDLVAKTIEHDLTGISVLWLAVDGLGAGAAVLMAMTISIMMVVPPREWSNGRDQVRDRLQSLKYILYAGTTLLVTSVLQFDLLLTWCEAHVEAYDPIAAFRLHDPSAALVNFRAVFLSLTLLSIFAPAAVYLRSVGERLITQEMGPEPDVAAIKEQMAKSGYTVSIGDLLPKIAAILAPLLTGAFSELFRQL